MWIDKANKPWQYDVNRILIETTDTSIHLMKSTFSSFLINLSISDDSDSGNGDSTRTLLW